MQYIVLSLIGLVLLLAILINLSSVQNFIARQVVSSLSKQLETKVSLKNLHIDLLNQVVLEGLYIEDRNKDTLLYAGEARIRITDWFILRKETPVIRYVGLHNAYANLYRTRTSDEWNYQFVIDAFDTGPSTKPKKEQKIDIDLKEVDLTNVRFHMDDAWVGSDMEFDVDKFSIDARRVNFDKKIIHLKEIEAAGTRIVMRDYEGGRPAHLAPKRNKITVIDTTAFNPGNWEVTVDELTLDNCLFRMDYGNEPALKDEFDTDHMLISSIMLQVEDLKIVGDTLTSQLKHLSAKERCGITIKKMQADVRVSPNESICENLYLETNNSKLRNYYAMRYDRFPDFNHYIDSVEMEVKLEGAKIDAKDIAYFAPVLRQYPTILTATGWAKGTVADIQAKGLNITDGYTTVKGNLHMKGLPDINNTYIDYTQGELFTSGRGLAIYEPSLLKNESVNIGAITHAYFKGDFKGYISNFAVNGTLTSNLGSIVSNVKMNIPPGKNTVSSYSGNVKVNNLNLGVLLRQPDMGTVTLTADVKGKATNIKQADIKFNTIIDHFEFKNYKYQGINADGTVAQQKFNGNLIINDPNLALGFYGEFDFSDTILKINAKSNLLQSNLTALHLFGDSTGVVELAADFDLDWQGNNIDNFTGAARLYNINLERSGHRLDLDSVHIVSTQDGAYKQLSVQSNAVAATMKGNYQLSTLPTSFQYYVANYVPNYITKIADKTVPPQDITFDVVTYDLDSLFGIFMPSVSGFNDATINGSLNTQRQQLQLDAYIPSGIVSGIQFDSVTVDGNGNLERLTLDAKAAKVTLPDTSLHGALAVNASLGNDKLDFSIATKSPNALGTASLRGNAYSHGDTIDATIQPSEFFLNEAKWEIPGGNKIVYTDGYLDVSDLSIQSGKQSIRINSANQGLLQKLNVAIANLDVNQLGRLAGLAAYNPGGKINGDLYVEDMFNDVMVVSNIKATNVVFSGDTIGNVNISGSYDGKVHLVNLNPETGVYRGDKSLNVTGRISFDSTNTENIDGRIFFNNTPMSWLAPVLAGYVSNISGTLDGNINIKGTSANPDIDGKISMNEANMRIDFLGTQYAIPKATITVDNKNIDFGNITIKDRFNNSALLTGGIRHNRFKNMSLNINMGSSKFEVINLKPNESNLFYGDLIVRFESLYITGPFNNVSVRINKAVPAEKSHLYLPIATGEEVGAYSYITFKTNDTTKKVAVADKSKLSIKIDAILNPLAEITLIMDPATGDAINASGTGNISIDIPPGNDIRMYGNYTLESGTYQFTLPQLFFRRKFLLDQGSQIKFAGAIDNTILDVNGIYKTRSRLIDLLGTNEKATVRSIGGRELDEANMNRQILVILKMQGTLGTPRISFDLDVPDKSAVGTVAYNKLEQVTQDDRKLFNQVASLLLINAFIPEDGGFEGGASTGVVNNFSDIFSGTASSQLTNLLSRLTGDDDVAIRLKYEQYNYNAADASATTSGGARNEVSLGVTKNLFKDRLSLEVGSSIDWGKPTANKGATNFNPVGDFRIQYLLREGGNLRANIFRSSSYDILGDRNIAKGGVGLTWRKSFNNLEEFFRGRKYAIQKLEEQQRADSVNREEQSRLQQQGAAN